MPHDEHAGLLRQLATMTRAGMPAAEAFNTLARGETGDTARVLTEVSSALRSGESLASAVHRHHLFTEWEARVLDASNEAGRVEEALYGLADEYDRRATFARRLRARLVLPAAVFVLALLIAPVIGLAAGEYGTFGYLWRALLPLAAFWTLATMIREWWRRTPDTPGSELLSRLALRAPILAGLVERRARSRLLHALAMLLRSGVPAYQAMPLAVSAVPDPLLRQQYRVATVRLEDGATVADALKTAGALGTGAGRGMTASGEYAGSLDEVLEREGHVVDNELADREDLLAEWLPRVFYFMVMGYIASQVIGFYAGYFRGI